MHAAQAFKEDAGLDGQPSQGVATTIRFSVTGTAKASAITRDQASFFNRDADVAIDSSYGLATAVNDVARFSAAQTAQFIALNPSELTNVNITAAANADVVSSMKIQIVRFTPSGIALQQEDQASTYQNTGDYQDTRVQIPLSEVMDGYTFVRLLNDAQAVAATYKVNFTFSSSIDRRQSVARQGPMIVKSPK